MRCAEFEEQPGVLHGRMVAVTHGADGATLYRDGLVIAKTPAKPATVKNTVGAGDSFCAALTIALAANIDPMIALATAAAVGAAAVEDDASQPSFSPWHTYV